jgi:20S proteasome alpha/beta subunit
MTTIVCDLTKMVGDRRITIGDLFFPATKIFKIKGEIVGAAGLDGEGAAFMEWLRKPTDTRPVLAPDSFEAIVLRRDGIYYYDYTCIGTKVELPFYAIGNGALGALCAMERGATPEEAVQLVAKHSHGTGSEIDVLTI